MISRRPPRNSFCRQPYNSPDGVDSFPGVGRRIPGSPRRPLGPWGDARLTGFARSAGAVARLLPLGVGRETLSVAIHITPARQSRIGVGLRCYCMNVHAGNPAGEGYASSRAGFFISPLCGRDESESLRRRVPRRPRSR